MIKKLYLHIGAPKTGTTSIQSFFFSQTDWLKDHSVTYFNDMCGNLIQHYAIFSQFHKNYKKIVETLLSSDYDYGILSTELLSFIVAAPRYKNLFFEVFGLLSSREIQIEVVGVVREPLSYLVSAYGEDVAGGRCPLKFTEWLHTAQGAGHKNVVRSMLQWEDVPGVKQTHWYPFEQSSGSIGCVDMVICKLLDDRVPLAEIASIRGTAQLRKSFNGSVIEAARRINADNVKNWNSYSGVGSAYDFFENLREDLESFYLPDQKPHLQANPVDQKSISTCLEEMIRTYNNLNWASGSPRTLESYSEYKLSKDLDKLSFDENFVVHLCSKWNNRN